MSFKSFLRLVEIQTKVASVIPLAIGTLYAIYRFGHFNTVNFFLMLISLLAIDMAATALNNYQDYKKAHVKHGFGYESHNAIVRDSLDEKAVKGTILGLLAVAAVFGFALFLRTDLTVLAVGGVSFALAVSYSWGPVPISRTPFGEIFSGGFMGFIIPFLAVYIHAGSQAPAFIALKGWTLAGAVDIPETFFLGLVTMPAIAGIANIMLANNICDMEDDVLNRRYTLPVIVGRETALLIFKLLYAAGFLAVAAALVCGALPLFSLFVLATAIPVRKNVRIFMGRQLKGETFATAVANFAIVNLALALSLAAGIIFR